jgi:hypothetical protein
MRPVDVVRMAGVQRAMRRLGRCPRWFRSAANIAAL